jgi:hypothetical protein
MNLYNTIQKVLNTASSHILVNEVGEGDIYEYLNSGEHKYPCVFLTVTSVVDNEYTRNINGTLFYVDRLLANQSNKTSIQSVAVSVLRDMLQALNVDVDTIEYNTFTEKFTDLCAGAYVDCQIPIDFTSLCEDNFEMKVKSITENGIYEIEGYDTVDVKVVDKESQLVIEELEDRINSVTGLTITDNGVYTPPEGVLGYDNIEVNVEGGSGKWKVPNEVLFPNSGWTEIPGELDFSEKTTYSNGIYGCFQNNYILKSINHPLKGSTWGNAFSDCSKLTTISSIDITDASNSGALSNIFNYCKALSNINFIGSINTNISFPFHTVSFAGAAPTDDTLRSILTDCSNTINTNAKTLSLGSVVRVDSTGEWQALVADCTSKGWTINGLTLQ